jgi:hypothetical protein
VAIIVALAAHALSPEEDRHFGLGDFARGHAIDQLEEIHWIGVEPLGRPQQRRAMIAVSSGFVGPREPRFLEPSAECSATPPRW